MMDSTDKSKSKSKGENKTYGVSGVSTEESADGRVLTVVLHRPDRRNAVDGTAAAALFEAFTAFDASPVNKVAVLWGAGGTFCAGADLIAISSMDGTGNPVNAHGLGPMGPSRMKLSKPVIAAVSGHAVAGGLELACWCDLRVAEETAIFGVFCRRWGVPLIDGGTVRLPRLVGQSRALDLILTGRPCDAAEAERIGLANRVVPTGDARRAAEQLAAEIATFPEATMLTDRASVLEQWSLDEDRAMLNEFAHGSSVLRESVKGASRFKGGAGRGGSFDLFKGKL